MKCEIVQDLLPLYAEDLVSQETKGEIENHLAHCKQCATFFQNPSLSSIEIPLSDKDKDKNAKQTFIKLKLIQEQYFIILIGLGIAVYSSLFSLNGFDSIPWIILIPFGLMVLYGEVKKISLTIILMTLVFAALGEDFWYGIWMLPLILWCSGSGIWMASFINKKLNLKRTLLLVVNLLMIGTSLYFYAGLKGNPIGYILAHQHINEYINEHYIDIVRLEDIHYSSKYNGYIGTVVDTKDSYYQSSIIDLGDTISDYVEFQIHENMTDEVKGMLELLILTQTNLTRDDFNIDIHIPDLTSNYRLSDAYDPEISLSIHIYLNQVYTSKTQFATVSFELMNIIESSHLDYLSVKFESFLENGNDSYILNTNQPFISLDEAIKNISIHQYNK